MCWKNFSVYGVQNALNLCISKQYCLPPLYFKITLRYRPFHISLNWLGFYLSPECLLNFLWLVHFTICEKKFSVYGVENVLSLCIAKQCCVPPLYFKISLRDTSFHISLNSLGFCLSPECFLNFLWLVHFTICEKNFSVYGVESVLSLCIAKQCCVPPLYFKISLRDTSFHISLNSLGFCLSTKCLLSFLWLADSTMCGKNFSVYDVENPVNLSIFTHVPIPQSKLWLQSWP